MRSSKVIHAGTWNNNFFYMTLYLPLSHKTLLEVKNQLDFKDLTGFIMFYNLDQFSWKNYEKWKIAIFYYVMNFVITCCCSFLCVDRSTGLICAIDHINLRASPSLLYTISLTRLGSTRAYGYRTAMTSSWGWLEA